MKYKFIEPIIIPPIPILGNIYIMLKSGRHIEAKDCEVIDNEKELYMKFQSGYLMHVPKENIEYYAFRQKERKEK